MTASPNNVLAMPTAADQRKTELRRVFEAIDASKARLRTQEVERDALIDQVAKDEGMLCRPRPERMREWLGGEGL